MEHRRIFLKYVPCSQNAGLRIMDIGSMNHYRQQIAHGIPPAFLVFIGTNFVKSWEHHKEKNMEYGALAICMADELLLYLQNRFYSYDIHFESVSTVQEANRKLNEKAFHLLIVDLECVRSIGQSTWLERIRHISYAPLIVLSDTPEKDSSSMVELGTDICVSGTKAMSVLGDIAFAQFRRYTEYNHRNNPHSIETAPFQLGDIFIDPARRIVEVRGKPVSLRPREFSLLLYFMRNPNIVLTSEQICDQAWGMGGSYNRGVSQPIRILRLAIEPNPNEPIYIETVRLVGYRFTACNV